MNQRFVTARGFCIAAMLLAPSGVFGQPGAVAVEKAAAALAPKGWKVPRLPNGQPDLQGTWNNGLLTPLERPADLAGKAFFTGEEAAAYEKRLVKERNADQRLSGQADVLRAYNDAWWDRGTKVARTLQTSMVVDPPDGRIPSLTEEAQKRVAARLEAIKEKCADPTRSCVITNGGQLTPADGPEDLSYMDRCILWRQAGPPMLPDAYNNNYQIVQTPEAVLVHIETIHDARIIPLDGRPHLPSTVRQFLGDPRGHWEGDTLVVETTNFSDDTNFRNAGRNMRLVERFTRTDPETLLYEFTVDDPTTFTKPWTGIIPMVQAKGPIFEYACHEGNYGLEGIMRGARVEEKRRAAAGDAGRATK